MQSLTRPPSLKERQRQERETLILQTAQEAFISRGYHDTSIEEIACQVGISKGTVYQHFACKDDLLLALVVQSTLRLQQDIEEAIASASTAQTKMAALLLCLKAGWSRERTQALVSLCQNLDLQKILLKESGPLIALQQRFVQTIALLLEEGKATGEFNPELPTQAMLFALLTLFSPRRSFHLVAPGDYSAENLFDALQQILLRGILPDHSVSEKARE